MTTLLKRSVLLAYTLIMSAFTYASNQISELETVALFTDYRGAGVTVTPKGRIIIAMHPLDAPKHRVVEIMANGSQQPFPNNDWSDGPENGKVGLASVLGVHSDSKGVVWMLDMGSEKSPTQLVAWDTNTNKLVQTIEIPTSVLQKNSFPQDFVIDEKRQAIYIADMTFGNFSGPTNPAIIVVSIKDGKSRRVLEGIKEFIAPNEDIVIEGVRLASSNKDGSENRLRFGLNPIAIDNDDQWVYFATMNGETVYRIPANSLADNSKSEQSIQKDIEVFGSKKKSDGMMHVNGLGIVVTDLENNAVGVTTKDGYRVLVQDKRLSWPDSLAQSGDYIYVTQDQLHQHPAFSQGLGNAKPPYRLFRFKFK